MEAVLVGLAPAAFSMLILVGGQSVRTEHISGSSRHILPWGSVSFIHATNFLARATSL